MSITSTILLLADAGPSTAETGNAVLIFVLVACPVISAVVGVLGVWFASRRNPPIGEEVHKNFVPRAEFNEAVARVDARVDSAMVEVASARTQFGKAFGDLERAIGRLEGRLDMMAAHEGSKTGHSHHHR